MFDEVIGWDLHDGIGVLDLWTGKPARPRKMARLASNNT